MPIDRPGDSAKEQEKVLRDALKGGDLPPVPGEGVSTTPEPMSQEERDLRAGASIYTEGHAERAQALEDFLANKEDGGGVAALPQDKPPGTEDNPVVESLNTINETLLVLLAEITDMPKAIVQELTES